MIAYHRNSQIDRGKWDSCILKSQSVKPYAYSWYLDIMAPGWEALIEDDYVSVFPLPCFSRFGINYIATPNFLQQLGGYSLNGVSGNMLKGFIDHIPEKFRLIDLRVRNNEMVTGYEVTLKSNLELDLNESYEKLWNGFSSDCRRNIRIGQSNRIVLNEEVSPGELIRLFMKNSGLKIKNLKTRDYNLLKNLMTYCIDSGKGKIYGVLSGCKKLISGVFLVNIPGSVTVLFTANTQESRDIRAGYFIISEIIRQNAGNPVILDFAGSSLPYIASFMKSFGSTDVPYQRIFRNSLPWPIRLFK